MASLWNLYQISDTTQLLFIFLTAFVIAYFIQQWIYDRKLPPGPTGLPIFGYLPFLSEEPQKKLWELSKKYGKIMSIYMGRRKFIIISDYNIAKEVLTHPAALARPTLSEEIVSGQGGIANSNGEEWIEQRRFVMHTMRDLGLGRGIWEAVIQEYAEVFAAEMKAHKGEAIDFAECLGLLQANNVLALLIGRRLPNDKSNPEVQLLIRSAEAVTDAATPSSINFIAPWLVKYLVFLRISNLCKLAKIFREFEDLARKEIENHMKVKDTEGPTDFIGHYILELERQKTGDKKNNFTVAALTNNLLALFTGGYDTTKSSIYWLLLYMATYQNIQKKVQEEIDDKIGRDSRVYWDERTNIPYTMAVIMEMERCVAITPLFPPRLAVETFTVEGYTIPKNSIISCNGWAMMRDPKYFKDPHNYNPEHFLTEDGKSLAKPESYLPFSIGKRNCPGETVAMMSIFIYFVSIMQKFTIKTTDGKPANFETEFAATIRPKYYQKLRFVER